MATDHRDVRRDIQEPPEVLTRTPSARNGGQRGAQVADAAQRPVLLLVHGAWHGAWNWEKVERLLTATGWVVETIDLPSVAEKGASRYGMHDDAAHVRRQIERIDRPVVVVAHSYGGMPVTEGAAHLPNVLHIVYLAAFQPDVGESPFELSDGTQAPWWNIEGDTVVPATPRETFYFDLPFEEAEWAIARLKPQSTVAATETVSAAAWRTISSTYVVCEQDRAMPPMLQEQMAQRATSVRRLNTGHSPFLSRPDDVAQLIAEVAVTASSSNRVN